MMKFKNLLGEIGYNGLLIMLVGCVTLFISWRIDNDTWFILNCGRYVVETGIIPHTEFATIHENLHYVMEQWLAAVIFWKIYSTFGADGLIFFAWLVGFILMVIYYKLCLYVSDGNKKISILLALAIAKPVTIEFIVTRPQILSTLILLIEIFLLEKFSREKKIWTLCILPILAVIFINIHAALFPMMIVLMLPFIAESLYLKIKSAQDFNTPLKPLNFFAETFEIKQSELIDILFSPLIFVAEILKVKPARDFDIPLKPLILSAVGIFLAGFINPYGLEAITFLFTSYDPTIHGVITEMQPASVGDTLGIILFVFSALLIIVFTRKSLPLRYFFLSFGMMILGIAALRNVFLFLMLATFPLAYAAKDWKLFDKIFNWKYKLFVPLFIILAVETFFIYRLAENSIVEMHAPMKIIFALSIIFLICFTFFYKREGKLFSEEIFILRRKPLIALSVFQAILFFAGSYFTMPPINYEQHKPAVKFLLNENRAEYITLWTGFNTGGYFEFNGIKCYIDARPEIFALSNNHQKDIIKEYLELLRGDLDYREFFSRYNFTHIFITTADKIPYLMLSNDPNYKMVFEYDFQQWGKKFHGKIFRSVKNYD